MSPDERIAAIALAQSILRDFTEGKLKRRHAQGLIDALGLGLRFEEDLTPSTVEALKRRDDALRLLLRLPTDDSNCADCDAGRCDKSGHVFIRRAAP